MTNRSSVDTENQPSGPSFLTAAIQNFKAFAQQPSSVASVCPSFQALTNRLADYPCVERAEVIVELGPGNGETTAAILRRMKPASRMVAIENNKVFMEVLRTIEDKRLTVIHGDAMNLASHLQTLSVAPPDVIVSGIPFSSLKPDIAKTLMQTIYDSLRPGGTLLAYQFRSNVCDAASPIFGTPEVETVWLNIPPLKVFSWTKS